PVLLLSALRTDRESRIRALESGADGFLSKPFDEVELSLQIRAMAKIKAANSMLRMEKTQLAALVAEHTHELELELAERERADRLTEVLYGSSQAIYSTVKLDDLFQRIHFLLSNIAPANNFFIALLRSDERFLSFPYNHDEKDTGDWPDIETDDPQSLTVEVLTTKRPLLLDEARLQDRYATGRNKVWGTAPRCWLGVPLIFKDNAIGVMAVQDYQNGFAYSQKDVTLLESVAGQIASAIEHKRAEAAILQAGNDWENTFNAVTDMITVHDRDFNILRANAAAKKILGISPQWKIPTKCYRNYHGKERPSEECPSCQCLLSGESCTIEIYEPHLDKYLEVRVMPRFEKDGSTVGLIHVVRDITERKRTEEEKIKMEAQLRQALKMESVGRLAGGVAHDFNNMLGVILGHVEIALDQVQPAQPLYADLTEIRLATERSADLTRQLLALPVSRTSPQRCWS
ncbi:MAG: GAF domain-containing protein, partial [Syntrophales bacterium LBB04]|nr:GAF domain-containing protein [Syntrophales bacterium LBB04]